MATKAEIRAQVDGLVGDDPQASDTEIDALIQLRYSHVYETWHWSRRTRDMVLSLVAQVSSGTTDTVTATLGSATVDSAGTPFTSAMDGRQIELGDLEQYLYVAYVSTSQITLEDGEGNPVLWPLDTASALTWRIFQSVYSLGTTAEALLSLAGDIPIEELDGGRNALDQMDSNRDTTANQPRYWFYNGENTDSVRTIEVWPVPSQARLLRGKILRKAPTLSANTETGLNLAYMTYAVAADIYNMLFSKTSDIAYQQLALFYERKSNEVGNDIKPIDLERTSPPSTLRRWPRTLGSDWHVTHLEDQP
jgi:hypothetical protein